MTKIGCIDQVLGIRYLMGHNLLDMSTIELKSQLLRLIEEETDDNVLNALLTLLKKASLDPVLKETLTIRALQSEEDIRANRVFIIEEVKKRIPR